MEQLHLIWTEESMQLFLNLIYLYKTLIEEKIQRWHKNVLVVYIDYNQVGKHMDKNELDKQIKSSFSAWEKALNGKIKFKFTTINYTNSEIFIKFAPHGLQDNKLGYCLTKTWQQVITKANIIVGLNEPEHIETTILHEIGHALGLRHSANKLDIMYAINQPNIKTLSQNDINIIRLLYELPIDANFISPRIMTICIKKLCLNSLLGKLVELNPIKNYNFSH